MISLFKKLLIFPAFIPLIILFASYQLLAGGSEGKPDPLKFYTECRFSDGLRIVEVDRLPSDVRSRSVKTASGDKSISMIDGYRIMLAYPDTDYFINLKVEKSAPMRYIQDKKHIIESFEFMSAQSKMSPLVRYKKSGYEIYGLNRMTIQQGGVISIYTLFRDDQETILTAYLLNQDPNRRKFQSFEEYCFLRDRFLSDYLFCIDFASKNNIFK